MKYVEMHFLITPCSQKKGEKEKKSAEIMSYYMVLKPPSQTQPVPFFVLRPAFLPLLLTKVVFSGLPCCSLGLSLTCLENRQLPIK